MSTSSPFRSPLWSAARSSSIRRWPTRLALMSLAIMAICVAGYQRLTGRDTEVRRHEARHRLAGRGDRPASSSFMIVPVLATALFSVATRLGPNDLAGRTDLGVVGQSVSARSAFRDTLMNSLALASPRSQCRWLLVTPDRLLGPPAGAGARSRGSSSSRSSRSAARRRAGAGPYPPLLSVPLP